MKYFVVNDSIESNNINTETLRKALTSKQLYAFVSLDEAKKYANRPHRAGIEYPVYEIEFEGAVLREGNKYCVIDRTKATTFEMLKAFCKNKTFYLDEYEFDPERDKDLVGLKPKETQEEIKKRLEEARKRVADAKVIEKEKQKRAAKISFYLNKAPLLVAFLFTSFLVGYCGGFFIIADLLLKMGVTLSLTKINLIAVSLLSGVLLPALVSALYYVGQGLRSFFFNDGRTAKEKHNDACNKLWDELKIIIDRDFSTDKRDQIFIKELIKIDSTVADIQFEKNGCISPSEKQPDVSRDQYLLFIKQALQELTPLRERTRKGKEEEILEDVRRKFQNTKG